MTPTEYQKFCKTFDRPLDGKGSYQELAFEVYNNPGELLALHHAVGIAGEAGELVDVTKKYVFYRKDYDIDNVKEEIGDLLWYVGNLLSAINSSFEEVMFMNKAKLEKRYSKGTFSNEEAVARADKKVCLENNSGNELSLADSSSFPQFTAEPKSGENE